MIGLRVHIVEFEHIDLWHVLVLAVLAVEMVAVVVVIFVLDVTCRRLR